MAVGGSDSGSQPASSIYGDSLVGVLCADSPAYVTNPPVEAVVFAWGSSEDRQLGLDTEENVLIPKVVESLLGLQLRGRTFGRSPLICGSRNTLAIDAAGQLWSWGWNARGTLGQGHRDKETKPQRVNTLRGVRIVQAAIGGWHCLALSDAGRVYAWGGNEYLQCGVEPKQRDVVVPTPCVPELQVRQVACGGMHSLALTTSGELWTWGEPWGDFALNVQRSPRRLEGFAEVGAIACGAFHSLALTRTGEVYSWGTNDYGQLGTGGTTYETKPTRVVDLDEVQVADVAAGGWHSLVLTARGEVFIWGRGEYGRLGIGDRTGSSKLRPQKVKGLENHVIVQAAAGGTHTMALSNTGRLFIWGRGSYGRLGLPSQRDHYHPVECHLPGGHERWRVAAVAAGGRHSMCLAVPFRDDRALEADELPVAPPSESESSGVSDSEPTATQRIAIAEQRADTSPSRRASLLPDGEPSTRDALSEWPSINGPGREEEESDEEALALTAQLPIGHSQELVAPLSPPSVMQWEVGHEERLVNGNFGQSRSIGHANAHL